MSQQLSLEDLRQKRLQALLGEPAKKIPATGATTASSAAASTTNGAVEGTTRKESSGSSDPLVPSRKGTQEVIDLSFTDSEDDEAAKEPKPKRPKKEAAPRRRTSPTPPSSKTTGSRSSTHTAAAEEAESSVASASTTFQVVSWNVWFGPPNGSNPHVRARMSEFAKILRQCDSNNSNSASVSPLWFVGFQEVTEESRVVLERSLPEYTFVRQPSSAFYYCMLGVRQRGSDNDPIILESGCVDFHRTVCARAFCYARVRLPFTTTEVLVATTHLESYCSKDYTGLEERQIQLLQFESFAQTQLDRHARLRSCMLMGDYNWDDESKSARLNDKTDRVLSLPSADAWLQYQSHNGTRAKDTCYTYDGPRNPMLGNRMRRRLDRCVAISRRADHLPRATRVDMLGTTELPGLRWDKVNPFTGATREVPTLISDHYGLLASWTVE